MTGSGESGAYAVMITISTMLFFGFLLTRITKRLKLPNVTGYIVAGLIIGPYGLSLVSEKVISGMEFLPDLALAFIAFGTGEYFRISTLKKNGMRVLVITIMESLMAALLVFAFTFFALRLNLAFCVVLSALATATAPASTMMTIRQTHARGDFVDILLSVVALDDAVGLVIYSIAVSIAVASLSGGQLAVGNILRPVLLNMVMLGLGCAFGLVLKYLIGAHSTDNRLIIAVAVLLVYCGICASLGTSPLLGCMAIGMVYINTTEDERLFRQLAYFSPPILLLFFVRSGVKFDLGALVNRTGMLGTVPLYIIGISYFIVRIAGKYLGAFWGCGMARTSPKVRNYLGLALIPQAGVAIGLASLGARAIGGNMGHALETIILSSSVLYELIGPASAKLSLYLSGSYSNKLEDIVEVTAVTEDGKEKTALELLIERIQKIQEELPPHPFAEEEQAFTEAAEQYASLYKPVHKSTPKPADSRDRRGKD